MSAPDTLRRHFVAVATLNEWLANDSNAVVVFDCRFNLLAPHQGFSSYLNGHIPGARYAHLDKDLSRPITDRDGRHPLVAPADFADFLAAAGLDPKTRAVVYDDQGGAIAARMWWLLGEVGHQKRYILDGGLAAWTANKLALTTRLPDMKGNEYPVSNSLNPPVLVADEIETFVASGGRLLDARAEPRFAGLQEPIDPVAGHVPGALNLPVSDLLDESGQLKPEAELRALVLKICGADGETARLGAMCGSGVTACLLAAAIESAGFAPPQVFIGSWSQWIRDTQRPIVSAGTDSG